MKVNSRRGSDPGNRLWRVHWCCAAVLDLRLGLCATIGLLGAFTTFSTFSFETMALLEVGSYSKALLNVGASVMLEEADCGSLMTLEKVEIIRYRPGK